MPSRIIHSSTPVFVLRENVIQSSDDPTPNAYFDTEFQILWIYHGEIYGNPVSHFSSIGPLSPDDELDDNNTTRIMQYARYVQVSRKDVIESPDDPVPNAYFDLYTKLLRFYHGGSDRSSPPDHAASESDSDVGESLNPNLLKYACEDDLPRQSKYDMQLPIPLRGGQQCRFANGNHNLVMRTGEIYYYIYSQHLLHSIPLFDVKTPYDNEDGEEFKLDERFWVQLSEKCLVKREWVIFLEIWGNWMIPSTRKYIEEEVITDDEEDEVEDSDSYESDTDSVIIRHGFEDEVEDSDGYESDTSSVIIRRDFKEEEEDEGYESDVETVIG